MLKLLFFLSTIKKSPVRLKNNEKEGKVYETECYGGILEWIGKEASLSGYQTMAA